MSTLDEDVYGALNGQFQATPEQARVYIMHSLANGDRQGAQQLMQQYGISADQVNQQLQNTPGRNTGGVVGKALNSTVRPIGEYVTEHPAALFAAPFIAAGALGAFGASAGAAGGAASGSGSGLLSSVGNIASSSYANAGIAAGSSAGGGIGAEGVGAAAGGGGGGGGFFSSLFGGGGGGAAGAGKMAFGTSDWLNLAGLLTGAYGANQQANAQSDASNRAAAAAKYNPYNINSAGGGALFGPGNQVTAGFSPGQQANYDQLGTNAQNYLSGNTGNSSFLNFANGLGNDQLPNLFQNLLNANGNVPTDAYSNFLGQNQSLGNQSQSLFNNLFGGSQGATGMGMNTLQQVLGQAQGGPNFGQSNALLGLSAGAAMGANQDMSGMVNSRLNLLRQQAAPQEAQQLQNTRDTLFGQGRMGAADNTIGGANPEMQALFNSFGQNDLNRQLSAQTLGMQAQQQMFGQGISQANTLGSLAGQSAYNTNNGYQGLLGLGSLGGQTLNQGFGQSANLSNLLGQTGNFNTAGLNASQGYSDLLSSRAGQSMQAASGLFGFGNDLNTQNLTTGLNMQSGQNNLQAMLNALTQMGGTFGTQQASAGANQATAYLQNNASPLGALFSGLGAGLMRPPQQQQAQNPGYSGASVPSQQTPNWMPGPNATDPIWGD